MENTQEIIKYVLEILEDKKAKDIKLIEAKNQGYIAQFVICASGSSRKNILSIAEYIKIGLKDHGVASKIEGRESENWVLIDIENIIIHIFLEEYRKEIKIEELIEQYNKEAEK